MAAVAFDENDHCHLNSQCSFRFLMLAIPLMKSNFYDQYLKKEVASNELFLAMHLNFIPLLSRSAPNNCR